MKKAYFVKTIEKDGLMRADVLEVKENENYRNIGRDCLSLYYFETKKRAWEIAAHFNHIYRKSCRYLDY